MPSAVNAASSRKSCHLSGYDNSRPVRIGNGAYNQRQHDIWGTMLDSGVPAPSRAGRSRRHCGRC